MLRNETNTVNSSLPFLDHMVFESISDTLLRLSIPSIIILFIFDWKGVHLKARFINAEIIVMYRLYIVIH